MTDKEKPDGRRAGSPSQPAAKRPATAAAGRNPGGPGSGGGTGNGGGGPQGSGSGATAGRRGVPQGGGSDAGSGKPAASPTPTAPSTGTGAGAGSGSGSARSGAAAPSAGAGTGDASAGTSGAKVAVEPGDLRLEEAPPPAPEAISLDDIKRGGGPTSGQPKKASVKSDFPLPRPTVRSGLQILFEAGYAIPAMAGYGEHWYLTKDESKALAEQSEAVVGALPASKVASVAKIIATISPAIGLVMTALVITKLRIDRTKELRHVQRSDQGSASTQPPAGGNGAPAGNGAGTGWAPGAVKGRGADLFRTSE